MMLSVSHQQCARSPDLAANERKIYFFNESIKILRDFPGDTVNL